MKRLAITAVALVVALVAAGAAMAQQGDKDVVVVEKKKGAMEKFAGRVLQETWRGVDLDRDGGGKADMTFPPEQVVRVEYANSKVPRYYRDAGLLRTKAGSEKEYIDMAGRAYEDDRTSKYILQHAFYGIAKAYSTLSKANPAMLPKAIDAYRKLFDRVPDTCYAVTGRVELGNLLVSQNQLDQAVKVFQELSTGTYGPKVALEGKMMTARAQLAGNRFEEADKLLTQVAPSAKPGEEAQGIKLLSCRCLIGQKKLDEAYKGLDAVLAEKPSSRTLGTLYSVMGDYFAARENYRAALMAYLKVPLMYPETDSVERAQAVQQAGAMLGKLGRAKDAELVKRLAAD